MNQVFFKPKTIVLTSVIVLILLCLINFKKINESTQKEFDTIDKNVNFLQKSQDNDLIFDFNDCSLIDNYNNNKEVHSLNTEKIFENVSPYTPAFKMYTFGDFPINDGDLAQINLLQKYIYKTKSEPNNCEIVLDVGGYYGDTGLYAAANGFHSIIFEPMLKFHRLIQKSIQSNKFFDKTCVFNVNRIVNNKVNEIYKLSKIMEFTKVEEEDIKENELTVKSTTIDSIILGNEKLRNCSIRYFKIDSEGYEPNVLLGAIQTIISGRVKSIIFEYTVFFQIKNLNSFENWSYLLTFLNSNLSKEKPDFYALDRQKKNCYGPILEEDYDKFYKTHLTRHLQTDILVLIDNDLKVKIRENNECSKWNENVNA